MATPIIGTGIPWYEREDYPRILEVMEDADFLPRSYDEWQERAEQAVRMVTQHGGIAVRVPLNAQKFRAWCILRGLHVDGRARQDFASNPANWPNKN